MSPSEHSVHSGSDSPDHVASELIPYKHWQVTPVNNNKCDKKGPSCDKGLHKCAKILRNGRPCGMSYHGAYNCRNV